MLIMMSYSKEETMVGLPSRKRAVSILVITNRYFIYLEEENVDNDELHKGGDGGDYGRFTLKEKCCICIGNYLQILYLP